MNQPKTILYAEDDAVTMTAYKSRLESSGYIVHTAMDGLEALKWLHKSPPDLLLLDLLLPKFTGEEVLKFVHSNPALGQIPVVVLSSNSIQTLAQEQLPGITGKHLLKHVCTFPKLLATIQELLAEDRETSQAGQLARLAKSNPESAQHAAAANLDADPLVSAIRKMQDQTPVVCAWTDRINIEGKWMKLTEFLSKQLHLRVTHGVSPEGVQQFFDAK